MAKPYKIPDFRKMYPEASEEVIAVLRTSERKMQYQEYDLKRARNIVDPKTGEKMTIPSREDSYERLQEMAVQFPEENRSVEDQILKKIECEQLHKFLLELSKEEQWLIQELYFEERTEREVASVLGLSQKHRSLLPMTTLKRIHGDCITCSSDIRMIQGKRMKFSVVILNRIT